MSMGTSYMPCILYICSIYTTCVCILYIDVDTIAILYSISTLKLKSSHTSPGAVCDVAVAASSAAGSAGLCWTWPRPPWRGGAARRAAPDMRPIAPFLG